MSGNIRYPEHLVFGLDIGTRSIVGTVGYKDDNVFRVIAQVSRFHETRAMLDGQIHDINKVSETITEVKKELEDKIERPLTDVCIAAAGRMLKTVTVKAEYEFGTETVVADEHIHSLNLLAVEKAYDTLRNETKEEDLKFYCVGYTVIHYFQNDYTILNLHGHKASKIGTELIATFLPEEVIDGLYAAVKSADLYVTNLTLEPIAAINVAIPENYRLLNIALVDVGAGTSDISITKDGSIVAYGMIPFAGDEITERIAKNYLVDFKTAEKIKTACLKRKTVSYKDIMGISHKLNTKEVVESVKDTIELITKNIADKIIELNGEKSVSAVFVVGGGGKIPGFVEHLSEYLTLPKERVALRGQEVLGDVMFEDSTTKKDSTLVTPIGICLNFYEQKNNFIFVQVNEERVKLYDNSKMTIADVAVQVGFPNEQLFPRRGKALTYYINGEKRMVRGNAGEAAIVKLNGKVVGIQTHVEQNDKIEIISSTVGDDASFEVRNLPEYNGLISFLFNGKQITCPKFVEVNETLVTGYYNVQNGDQIKVLNYYTLEQVLKFMDLDVINDIYVNNECASLSDKVYENFSIRYEEKVNQNVSYDNLQLDDFEETSEKNNSVETSADLKNDSFADRTLAMQNEKQDNTEDKPEKKTITVVVNGEPVVLMHKNSYIFVDVLDFYPFDTSTAKGSKLVTKVNDEVKDFTADLKEGDRIELYWEE